MSKEGVDRSQAIPPTKETEQLIGAAKIFEREKLYSRVKNNPQTPPPLPERQYSTNTTPTTSKKGEENTYATPQSLPNEHVYATPQPLPHTNLNSQKNYYDLPQAPKNSSAHSKTANIYSTITPSNSKLQNPPPLPPIKVNSLYAQAIEAAIKKHPPPSIENTSRGPWSLPKNTHLTR